jgi:hypothetical protein
MTKPLQSMLLAAGLLAAPVLASAGTTGTAAPADLALEPCMNGEVSADGTLPSRELAELRAAYQQLAKPNQHPYYSFMVAGRVVVQEP